MNKSDISGDHIINDKMQNNIKKYINLSSILDLKNYKASLQKWLSIVSQNATDEIFQQNHQKYITIIKPLIHRYHESLKIDPACYGFYCDCLSKDEVGKLRKVYGQLGKFQVMDQLQFQQKQKDIEKHLVDDENFKGTLKQPQTNLYILNLKIPPQNNQYQHWHSSLPVQKTKFTSTVVHGKGKGKKQLGIPTANLKLSTETQQLLHIYPNGIYLVEFTFIKGPKYHGVCSLGTNPHYQNLANKRVVEVYVFHDFGEDQFYEAQVQLQFLSLIRLQGKFENFDCFLNSMHNDIYVGMKMAQKV